MKSTENKPILIQPEPFSADPDIILKQNMQNLIPTIKKYQNEPLFKNHPTFINMLIKLYFSSKDASVLFLMLNKKIGIYDNFLYEEMYRIFVKDDLLDVAEEILKIGIKNCSFKRSKLIYLQENFPKNYKRKMTRPEILRFLKPDKIEVLGEIFMEKKKILSFEAKKFTKNGVFCSFEEIRAEEYLSSVLFVEKKLMQEQFIKTKEEIKKRTKHDEKENEEIIEQNSAPLFYSSQELNQGNLSQATPIDLNNSSDSLNISLVEDSQSNSQQKEHKDIIKDFEELKKQCCLNEIKNLGNLNLSIGNEIIINDINFLIKSENDKYKKFLKVIYEDLDSQVENEGDYILENITETKDLMFALIDQKGFKQSNPFPEFEIFIINSETFVLYKETTLCNLNTFFEIFERSEHFLYILSKLLELFSFNKILHKKFNIEDFVLYEKDNSVEIKYCGFSNCKLKNRKDNSYLLNEIDIFYSKCGVKKNFDDVKELEKVVYDLLRGFNKNNLANLIKMKILTNN